MDTDRESKILEILTKHEAQVLADWMKEQLAALTLRPDLMSETDLRQQSSEFLSLLRQAVGSGNLTDTMAPEWQNTREFLASISRSRALQGFSPSETATFIFSLKRPLFARLRQEWGADSEGLAEDMWAATVVLDTLGLYSTEMYQQSREDIIARQQEELLELSTPVVKLWEGILAVPLIGTLDSARTQVVMENLLQAIVETTSTIAIIDITGVPVIDTLVAQHLLKTVAATRLMGAECIISGIRPHIAQTIVELGLELGDVATKATLADALALALQRMGRAAT